MSGYRLHDPAALLAGLVAPFLVALALVPSRTELSATNEALIMVVAVVAVAALGTRAAGALAALSAAAWYDFFLTRPYRQFAIDDGEEIQTAVLLLVVGLVVSQLAVRVRRLRTVVSDAAHLTSLQGTARLVEDGGSPEEVVEYVRRELVGLLGLRGCRFEYGSLLGHRPRLEHDGTLWLRSGSRITEYARWPDGETELRVVGGGHYYGRFLLGPLSGSPLPPAEARLVAVALAAQTGAALETAGLSRQG
ncbi:DUF4118 domain-containing protein [Streptomyces sp. NBC_01310]|uniref:DUF4118 domain-containing protein n=1 Tax=Streptomyces sp. NBC_01310 TaxID=2903820 RepID=UPI0035B5C3AE|nr:DUF4118 domain-containing protein [Streptomyces sp. NBC_01310]